MTQSLKEGVLDLLIIGGGITGVGIALDAVTRGLTVGLVEMQDFAEGTSSRSTKLVHGGLRYLKQLQIKEVVELGRERAIVYENGPHVTTPVRMLLPFYKGGTFGPFFTALGLIIYDILAGVKKSERRFMLSADDTAKCEPLVKKEDLLGGGLYVEYRTDDARLTIEVIKAAAERGAIALNYTKAISIRSNNFTFTVTLEDQLTGETYKVKAKKVVNAAGPWVDEVRKLAGELTEKQLILSKGVHLVFDQEVFPLKQAIYFNTQDGRMVFAIPRDGKTYVGTTDTFYEGDPKDMHITAEERVYLLDAIYFMFPSLASKGLKIESGWAGVRPLIHVDGKSPSEISRKNEIWQSKNGLITIAGGKLTGYRKMAEKIVDLLCKQLQNEFGKKSTSCITKHLSISGGDVSGSKFFDHYVQAQIGNGVKLGLSVEETEQLARHYGTNVNKVYAYMKQAKGSLPPVIYGLLYYSIFYEAVAKPVDFFIRRTGALFFNIAFVEEHKEAVIDEMSTLFEWTVEQKVLHTIQLQEALANAKKA
ncbi:glycerol-3-phosphate dehydrogenase/oxidase [Solibacillus sp. FSL H8-0538]|uniref:glycerol-3-phosphate dehydrogenase/oxidase n=1 Tax=Solibacillus sp. FSL H8-0538 TaxID=2921400 RepID=UPI0030F86ECC